VSSLKITSDCHKAITASDDRTVRLWDLQERSQLKKFQHHAAGVGFASFSRDEKKLISGAGDSTVRVLNLEGSPQEVIFRGHSAVVSAVVETSDGKKLISGSDDNAIKIWDSESKKLKSSLKGHEGPVKSLALTSDDHYLLSGSEDTTLKIWDLETEKEEATLKGHTGTIYEILITSCQERIITAAWDNTIKVWSLPLRREEFTLRGHSYWINTLALTPDEARIVSGGWDNSIKVWDIDKRCEEFSLNDVGERVWSIAVSSDGARLFSGSQDKRVRVFNLNYPSRFDSMRLISRLRHKQDGYSCRLFGMDHLFLKAILDITPESSPQLSPLKTDYFTGLNCLQVVCHLNNIRLVRFFVKYSMTLPFRWIENPTETFLTLLSKFPNLSLVADAFLSRLITLPIEHHPDTIFGLDQDTEMIISSEDRLKWSLNPNLAESCENHTVSSSDVFNALTFTPTDTLPETRVQISVVDMDQFDNPSLDFFEIIGEKCPKSSHRIYGTLILGKILKYKWSSLRKYHNRLLGLTVLFNLLLIIHTVWIFGQRLSEDTLVFRVAALATCGIMLVLNTLFMVVEFFQMKRNGLRGYLESGWNVIDLLTVGLVYLSTILDVLLCGLDIGGECSSSSESIEVVKSLYALIYLCMGVKMFYFLRGYSNSSFLVNMIIQVIKDMATFLAIILIVTVSFSGAFFMLQKDPESDFFLSEASFGDIFYGSYTMLLGETNLPESFWQSGIRLLFVVYTLFNLIIMLNLLIAIISDTFERVQDSAINARNYELLQLVLEYRQLVGDHGFKRVFLWVISARNEEEEDDNDGSNHEWNGRIKEISRLISHSQREVKQHVQQKIDQKVDSIKKDVKDVREEVTNVRQEVSKIEQGILSQLKEIKTLLQKPDKSEEGK